MATIYQVDGMKYKFGSHDLLFVKIDDVWIRSNKSPSEVKKRMEDRAARRDKYHRENP